MEGLALNSSADQDRPLLRVEPVDACGEQRLDRWRNGGLSLSRPGAIREQLLEEERVPLGCLDDARKLGLRHPASCRERTNESRRLLLAQGLERDDRCPRPGRCPGRTVVEELGPRQAEHEDWLDGYEREKVFEQVEERGLRPLELVDDRDQRALAGERLEQPADCPERLLRCARGLTRPYRAEDPCGHERGVLVVAKEIPDNTLAAQSLEDLGQRPVRDAFAIRQATADYDPASVLSRPRELLCDPRLADAGRPDHRAQFARARLHRAGKGTEQGLEFALPADEGRAEAAGHGRLFRQLEQPPGSDRGTLAL